MSSTPSFRRFDYLLRINKHIERKLVFDVLVSATKKLGFSFGWYLGLGSMWFGDFRLAHRLLGIDNLVSIEREEYSPRARFNRPFGGITVEAGSSTEVIERIGHDSWAHPFVAWLDYDGHLNDDVVLDLDRVLQNCAPNSVVLVTVNGARGTYRVRKPDPRDQLKREETSVGVVERFLGVGVVSPRYEPKFTSAGSAIDVSERDFSEFLTEAITIYLIHRINVSAREHNGRRLRFVPLYRIHHRDGADMVTVGGAVVYEDQVDVWAAFPRDVAALVNASGDLRHCSLDLVPVTLKEKIVLDECLPCGNSDNDFLSIARAAGLKLDDDDILKYRSFYRHFPVFAETSI